MNKVFPRNRVIFSRDNLLKIRECYRKDQIIEGPDVGVFEKMFASYIRAKYAVSFSSARSGLITILGALNFHPGDEIILPAYTFHVIPAIIKSQGLKPVFVDIRNDTYTINTSLIEKSITKKTKAIFATHILGHPCDMDDIMALSQKYNLKILEDCAHACGAEYKGQKVGSFGIASIFSFGMGKLMNCFGGGMVTCQDEDLRDRILEKRRFYENFSKIQLFKHMVKFFVFCFLTNPKVFAVTGYVVMRIAQVFHNDIFDRIPNEPVKLWHQFPKTFFRKFTNVQAAIGIQQLESLDENINKIIGNTAIYFRKLAGSGLDLPFVNPEVKHVYLYFRIRLQRREKLKQKLLEYGVDIKKDDIAVCPELDIFSESDKNYPVAKEVSRTSLELPCYYSLSEGDIHQITEEITKSLGHFV